MSNVFYVKVMDKNLISYARVTDGNKIFSEGDTSKIFNKRNNLIAIAHKEFGLYKMSYVEGKEVYVKTVEKMTQKEKFHKMLGHVNFNYLNQSWDLVAHFEPISESTPTVPLLPLVS